MKYLFALACVMLVCIAQAQREVIEELDVAGQDEVELKLSFAEEILVEIWDKPKVRVEVSVEINDGDDNDLYALESSSSAGRLAFYEKEKMFSKGNRNRNCWQTTILYKVYMPSNLKLIGETISGNFTLPAYGKNMDLSTISGDIDVSVKSGADFSAETISGEVYSDLEITYPHGKDGLHKVVGMDVEGVIGAGGERLKLKTISGNIYLRKG